MGLISLFPASDEAFCKDREMNVDLILVWQIATSKLNNKKIVRIKVMSSLEFVSQYGLPSEFRETQNLLSTT